MGAGACKNLKNKLPCCSCTRNKYLPEELDDDFFEQAGRRRSRSSKSVEPEKGLGFFEPVREPKLPELLSRHIYGNDDPFQEYDRAYLGEDFDSEEADSEEDEADEANSDSKEPKDEDDDDEERQRSKESGQESEDTEPYIDEKEEERQRLLTICDAHELWVRPHPKQLVTRNVQHLYKSKTKADAKIQASHEKMKRSNSKLLKMNEAVVAHVIGGPWCRVVNDNRKVRKDPAFRGGSKVKSTGLCWHRGFVERAQLEAGARKISSCAPVLSFNDAQALAAKGRPLQRRLAKKYSLVVDTEGKRWFWSHDFQQLLKALRFQRKSGPVAVEEEELMVLAAENGIDLDSLFPPLQQPAPIALVNSVPVPRGLLKRRRGRVHPPPIPALPKPDPKTMYRSFLPVTMEYVRVPPHLQKHVEDGQEESQEEHDEEEDDDDFFLKEGEEEESDDDDFLLK